MKFETDNYKIEELTLNDETIRFRAFRNLTYVEYPVNEDYQQMNIFVPEAYYEGKEINGYTLDTAPVFMPNLVGGFMPGKLFIQYINSLDLKDEDGQELKLDENGNGTFKEYVEKIVMESAQRSIDHKDLKKKEGSAEEKSWLTIENKKVTGMDFDGYVNDITRMKTAPAFDSLAMDSPENDLFGNETNSHRHFTKYSQTNSTSTGEMAEDLVIKMMNPMYYINDKKADTAKYFRIRHGECDRDTSLAISAILTLKLRQAGCMVDYHSPWNVPHSGDYDLEELFAWIDEICK